MKGYTKTEEYTKRRYKLNQLKENPKFKPKTTTIGGICHRVITENIKDFKICRLVIYGEF